MYLTPEDVTWLAWNGAWILSLGICLLLLFNRSIRHRTSPLSWLVYANLIIGGLFYATYPAAALQERWFAATDPKYPNLPFEGESLYIPDPAALGLAAYGCFGSYSSSFCDFPLLARIKDGSLRFVEFGTDPVQRFEIHIHDPQCSAGFSPIPMYDPHPGILSAALGICVLGEPVERAEADHVLTVERRNLPFPSQRGYVHGELTNRATGELVNAFDNIYRPLGADPVQRGPKGDTAALLDLSVSSTGFYDRDLHDALLAEYGLDQAALRAAAASEYQSQRAEAFWMACRDSLRDTLSPETVAAIQTATEGLFTNAPDTRFPEDCPPFAR